MRWLSRIFIRNACVYQTVSRWDLPPYRITIWVIDWWCNVYLFSWLIDTTILLQRLGIGNWWIRTRIDYHPCITDKPTNQVWLFGFFWSFKPNPVASSCILALVSFICNSYPLVFSPVFHHYIMLNKVTSTSSKTICSTRVILPI